MRKIHLNDSGSCTDVVANKGLLEDIHIFILVSYPCVLYLTLEMDAADRMTADHPTLGHHRGLLSSHDMKGSFNIGKRGGE